MLGVYFCNLQQNQCLLLYLWWFYILISFLCTKLVSLVSAKSEKYRQLTFDFSIWLPTECWVDALKLLSRAQLLRGVQPACRRLHAISELPDVPSIHVVRNFGQFLHKLERNQKGAKRQYEELTASKAELARHFRLDGKVGIQMRRQRRDKSQIGYKVLAGGGGECVMRVCECHSKNGSRKKFSAILNNLDWNFCLKNWKIWKSYYH